MQILPGLDLAVLKQPHRRVDFLLARLVLRIGHEQPFKQHGLARRGLGKLQHLIRFLFDVLLHRFLEQLAYLIVLLKRLTRADRNALGLGGHC